MHPSSATAVQGAACEASMNMRTYAEYSRASGAGGSCLVGERRVGAGEVAHEGAASCGHSERPRPGQAEPSNAETDASEETDTALDAWSCEQTSTHNDTRKCRT